LKELKIKELRKLKDEDLNKRLNELKLELMKEIASIKMKKTPKDTKRIKVLKTGIARILTILSERGKEAK
jgi:ribosomal protein L29